MSLVDGDHVQPAKSRHGAHYYGRARWDGKIVPAMTMYRTQFVKRRCPDCSKMVYDELICMYCGRDLSEVAPQITEAHK